MIGGAGARACCVSTMVRKAEFKVVSSLSATLFLALLLPVGSSVIRNAIWRALCLESILRLLASSPPLGKFLPFRLEVCAPTEIYI